MNKLITIYGMSIMLCACATAPGLSQQEVPPLLAAYQPGDGDMTCDQLTTELNNMASLVSEAKQKTQSAQTTGLAAGAATNAAVYGGALGNIPGLGMAASVAGDFAQQRARQVAEREAENAQNAQIRHTSLSTMSAQKGC
ncbi:MAG: hypothetical protein AAF583_04180 [Pseudomonadota bacterium]